MDRRATALSNGLSSSQAGSTRTAVLARIGFLGQRWSNAILLTTACSLRWKPNPVVRRYPDVRMWLYIAKGDCDNELQFPEVARRDWRIVRNWPRHTQREVGLPRRWRFSIPYYYLGDLATSRRLVSQALTAAKRPGMTHQ